MLEMGSGAIADGGEPSGIDCMPGARVSLPDRGNEDLPDCPFGPMTVAQGCKAAASLPAPTIFFDASASGALAPNPGVL